MGDLLLTGEEPVDYKIQPAVVTKLGASIDMENFFEEDVIGNIAALLGIGPANIQLTEIVREGSVRRKKRSEADGPVVSMRKKKKKGGKKKKPSKKPAKKPATKAPTTQAPTTTEYVEPFDGPEEVTPVFTIEPPPVTNLSEANSNSSMSFNDLNVAMAQLTAAFQDGSMGSALGLNLTTVEMQAPI